MDDDYQICTDVASPLELSQYRIVPLNELEFDVGTKIIRLGIIKSVATAHDSQDTLNYVEVREKQSLAVSGGGPSGS
jgi:hypothetical protein